MPTTGYSDLVTYPYPLLLLLANLTDLVTVASPSIAPETCLDKTRLQQVRLSVCYSLSVYSIPSFRDSLFTLFKEDIWPVRLGSKGDVEGQASCRRVSAHIARMSRII